MQKNFGLFEKMVCPHAKSGREGWTSSFMDGRLYDYDVRNILY